VVCEKERHKFNSRRGHRDGCSRNSAGAAAMLAAYAFMLACAEPAMAEPRGGGYFGCTVSQIQHYSGCVELGDQQIVNGSSKAYRVVCSPDGKVSCCEVENGNVVDGSCVGLSGRPNPARGIVAPNAGFSPSGIFTSPPHRGPVAPRPPHGGIKYPGGNVPPKGHRPPVNLGGFKSPSGVKTTGGNAQPVTIMRKTEHQSGGGKH
jgi:hypothetical protein